MRGLSGIAMRGKHCTEGDATVPIGINRSGVPLMPCSTRSTRSDFEAHHDRLRLRDHRTTVEFERFGIARFVDHHPGVEKPV